MPSEFIQRQIDGLLTDAAVALGRSDWPTVAEKARNALALDPENEDAESLLAAFERAGRSPRPVVIDDQTTPASPPTLWQEVRAKKGLGASLTLTGLMSVMIGIILHFALRTNLIETTMRLGYFFGLVGLFLFLIGLLIVF